MHLPINEPYLRFLALFEEGLLARLVCLLVLGEVARLAGLLHNALVYTSEVHLGRSSDNVSCVDPSQWNAIDFERTGNEEDALLEVLQEDNALAAEATSKKDDDGAGSEGCANLGRAEGLAGLEYG